LGVKKCPQCGSDIELFSIDPYLPCPKCGFLAYNDIQSCLAWCKYARECVGDEIYEQFMGKKADTK
jgi:hypothetical protein